MEALQILAQNSDFLLGAYNVEGMVVGLLCILLVDTVFKGWAMWRAARMQKKWWFIAILLINSAGVFPAVFLLTTHAKYQKFLAKKSE